ncbi:sugar phosphate isomerase/epimerase family protein [Halalkalibaculum sp. DA3122]|uniref:sugar phosphate isomerase/epimerase family protein n=1 Tax=Halalkalibaculum sp. DA3122 TaxID=3373607 RepID=UPI003754BB83
MPLDRRTFISNLALGSGGMLVGGTSKKTENRPGFAIPDDFNIIYLATRWGYPGTLEEFCQAVQQAGYDGIEVWLPGSRKEQRELVQVTSNYDLKIGLLVGSGSNDFEEHFTEFKQNIDRAVEMEPLLINCHSGRDFFSFEQNRKIVDYTVQLQESSGIGISHETHRSRMLFAAHITQQFIEQIPGLRLTLDISHWCNVHESLLANQPEAVELALERTDHVHSRVGHPEGPQVSDPRAPEWEQALEAHFGWWDAVVKQKVEEGRGLTMTPEFGPPTYMPAVPYTGQPLGNQWEINTHMLNLWKERYS